MVQLQAVTEHHVLVLFPHKVVALNTVSRQCVQQLPLTGRAAIGNPLGLSADPATGTVYLYTGATVRHACFIRASTAAHLPLSTPGCLLAAVSRRPASRRSQVFGALLLRLPVHINQMGLSDVLGMRCSK